MCGFFDEFSYQKTIESQDPFFFEVEIWLKVYPFINRMVVKSTCLSWKYAFSVGNHLILILNEYELLNFDFLPNFHKKWKNWQKIKFFKVFSYEFFITKFSKMKKQVGWRKILMVDDVVKRMKVLMKFVWKSCFFLAKNVGITP